LKRFLFVYSSRHFLLAKSNVYECFVEVYKCLREQWCQTSDNIAQFELRKQAQSRSTSRSEHPANSVSGETDNAATGEETASVVVPAMSVSASGTSLNKPVLACRVRPPANLFKIQLAGAQAQQAKQTNAVDQSLLSGDMLGLGSNNGCLTKNGLDLKSQLAEKVFGLTLNEDYLAELNGNSNEILVEKM
jgi:hypothetical protein